MISALSDFSVSVSALSGRCRLEVQHAEGPLRPFLLLLDHQVELAIRLHQAGHAVTQIGLGPVPGEPLRLRDPAREPVPGEPDGHGPGTDVDAVADDVAHLIDTLDLRGRRSPVAVGQGLGAAIALSLAARRGQVAALACIDGGWNRLPGGTDPRALHPLVAVPVLFCVSADDPATEPATAPATAPGARARAVIARAMHRGRPGAARASWYPDGELDIPRRHPGRLAEDLLVLAERAEPGPADPSPRRRLPGGMPGYLPLPGQRPAT